ncbi:class I SAM-dependent methyltransferase [Pacificispira sp.]|uniref:class I SAM-dependent methyltransferase n=1 Tax=Pacificispira sp. TaxID=2888761 RepID=UPI003BAD825F
MDTRSVSSTWLDHVELLSSPTDDYKPAITADGTQVKVLLAMWGQDFIEQFFALSFPTLMAPGNLPGLAQEFPTEFVFLTGARDRKAIEAHPEFRQLKAVCAVSFLEIDDLIIGTNYSTTVTLAYTRAMRSQGDKMLDTYFVFMVSDYIMADGSLRNLAGYMRRGVSGVYAGNFQIAHDEVYRPLREWVDPKTHVATIPPRDLMRFALNHLHPVTIANFVDQPVSHNRHGNRLFWRIDDSTVAGRFFLMHMLCIKPELTDFQIGSSCDFSFIPELCPSGNVAYITDSDEYLVVEHQMFAHETGYLRGGPGSIEVLAHAFGDWSTEPHRKNANTMVVFHADGIPECTAEVERESQAYIDALVKKMPPANPYRGHKFWISAINDFVFELIRQNRMPAVMKRDGRDQGKPSYLRRKYWDIFGRAPHVTHWHYAWLDYKDLIASIETELADKDKKVALITDAINPVTLWLGRQDREIPQWRASGIAERGKTRVYGSERVDCVIILLEPSNAHLVDNLFRYLPKLVRPGARILLWISAAGDSNFDIDNFVASHSTHFFRSFVTLQSYKAARGERRRAAYQAMLRAQEMLRGGRLFRGFANALSGVVSGALENRKALRGSHLLTGKPISGLLEFKVTQKESVLRQQPGPKRTGTTEPVTEAEKKERALEEGTKETQYNNCLDVRDEVGFTRLGLMTNQVWHDDPRRLVFSLARYKFVSKMMSGRARVAELGCGDAFGSRIVLQEVGELSVFDFDPLFIDDVRERYSDHWPLKSAVHDILEGPLPGPFDGIYSLDVLEHIPQEKEHVYMDNLCAALDGKGIAIIGMPSLESQVHASPVSKEGHVNCKTGKDLKKLCERYFETVFVFSMNDEVVHTGYYPMAHYIIALCCHRKSGG